MNELDLSTFYINTKNSKASKLLYDVINTDVTLNTKFVASKYNEKATPFKEIQRVEMYKNYSAYYLKLQRKKKRNIQIVLDGIYERLYNAWDTSKCYIVFHSSGFDSRVISHFIRKIYLERGGNVKFICKPPECEAFEDIMRYEGWDQDQYLLYNRHDQETAEDFKNIWKQVNGVADYPWNGLYTTMEYLLNHFKLQRENTVIITGGFFNELFLSNCQIQEFIEKYYYSRYSKFLSAVNIPVIYPILNEKTLIEMFGSRIEGDPTVNRKTLCKHLDPKLYAFPRVPDGVTLQQRKVDKNKIVDLYKESYYHKNINSNVIKDSTETMHKNPQWWSSYTLASLIDHLKNTGIKINEE